MGSHIRHAAGDDCSRLVHEIYERAGFPYPYATSRELYGGASQLFRRVWTPQPGDLIVWAGHVGIVVSPGDHLFFSKLTSAGQDVASYDERYWRSRGRAHFLRYINGESGVEVAVGRETKLAESASAEQYSDPPAAGAALVPAGDSEPASASPSPHLERDAEVRTLESRQPKPEDVRRAVMQQLIERDATVGHLCPVTSPTNLVVFDTLRVDRVRLDGNEGEAELRIHQIGSVIGGRANSEQRTQRAFWWLRRRDPETWEIEAPPDAVYLTRQAAVPVIAHCLAVLSEGHGSTGADDKSQGQSLVHLLSALIVP
jgi:hypothetical protein